MFEVEASVDAPLPEKDGSHAAPVIEAPFGGMKIRLCCLTSRRRDRRKGENTEASKEELEAIGDDGELVIIDGCPINCAEEIMKKSGFLKYRHINITDFGIIKGKTPVTEDKIEEIVKAIIE